MTLVRRLGGAVRGLLPVCGLLLALTAFLAAVAPAALTSAYDRALRESLEAATGTSAQGAAIRIIAAVAGQRPASPLGSPDGVAAETRAWRELLPPSLRRAAAAPELTVTTGRWRAGAGLLDMAWRPGMENLVRYVEGTAPANAGVDARPRSREPMRVALSGPVAEQLKVKVGSRFDLLGSGISGSIPVLVSGIYAALDGADAYWTQVPTLQTATFVEQNGAILPAGTAVLDFGGYARLYGSTLTDLRYDWRMPLNAAGLTAAKAARMIDELAEYRSALLQRTAGITGEVDTDLSDRLRAFSRRLHVAQAMLGLILIGVGAAAAGVLVLFGRLLGERFRPGLALMRARGASLRQLAMIAVAVPALAALPAALAGYLAALRVQSDVDALPSILGVLLVTACAVAAPAITVVGELRREVTPGRREDLAATRSTPRRLVMEAALAGLAVVGVVLARQRGQDAERGLDPLIGAVPVLVALAAGLVLARCYPYVLRAIGRPLRRGRSGAGYIALARAARQGPAALLPLVVLLLAAVVTGFAATAGTALDQAQRDAAFTTVGADARVSNEQMDEQTVATIRRQQGVTGTAAARLISDAKLVSAGRTSAGVNVLAIDLAAYRAVIAKATAATAKASATTAKVPKAPAGTDWALMSPGVGISGTRPVSISLPGGGPAITVRPAGSVDGFATQAPGSAFVVIPFSALPMAESYATTVFVSGDNLDVNALREASISPKLPQWARAVGLAGGIVQTYEGTLDDLAEAPLTKVVQDGFRYGLLAAAYGALAIVLAYVLSAPSRSQTVGYLRALGLNRRQSRIMALAEVGPLVACAAVAGWATGLLLPRLIGPAVDLRPYTGGFPAADLTLDPVLTPVLAAALAVVALAAAAVDGAVNARRPTARLLRLGEQR